MKPPRQLCSIKAGILAVTAAFAFASCESTGSMGLRFNFGYEGISAGVEFIPPQPKLPTGDGSAKSPVLVDPVK